MGSDLSRCAATPNSGSGVGPSLIHAEKLGKKFCRSLKKSLKYGVQDVLRELNPRSQSGTGLGQLRAEEFWAVNDVSFELRRGECLGLIGRNGAGKTTLLKALNGLIKPDAGRIEMRGRVGALIALGAGFNPILSGRENVYVNGAVLGLKKAEIDAKLTAIVEFAEIGKFFDSPVQTYSSGMQVRLGFAVAAMISPDILLIDEVLAVGDSAFRIRCYNKIRDLLPHTAVVLVSHSMADISRVCTRVIVMKDGSIDFAGDVGDGIDVYNRLGSEGATSSVTQIVVQQDVGVGEVRVETFRHLTTNHDTRLTIDLSMESSRPKEKIRIRVVFFDEAQAAVGEWDSHHHDLEFFLLPGANRFELVVPNIRLKSGRYRTAVVVTDVLNQGYIAVVDQGLELVLKTPAVGGAHYKI